MNELVISPFSNSSIRDWPPEHFTRLIALLLKSGANDGCIRVIGTASQRLGANEIVRNFPANRVVNDCGRLAWNAVLGLIRDAACVIGNNSGIAHLGAYFGAPTVCVFGGSHQRIEWRPRGAKVIVLSRVIACSPCHLDHTRISPYNKACLREIAPDEVCDAALMVMHGSKPPSART